MSRQHHQIIPLYFDSLPPEKEFCIYRGILGDLLYRHCVSQHPNHEVDRAFPSEQG